MPVSKTRASSVRSAKPYSVDTAAKGNVKAGSASPSKPNKDARSSSASPVRSPVPHQKAPASPAKAPVSPSKLAPSVASPASKTVKKTVLKELLSTTHASPAFTPNPRPHLSAPKSANKSGASSGTVSPSKHAPAQQLGRSPSPSKASSPSKTQPAAIHTSPTPRSVAAQTSPTSRILGGKTISKPHKAVVNEIKRISNYNGVKPQEVVARIQTAPAKKDVVSEVQNMAKSGLVSIVPSSLVKPAGPAKH